jgi:hypothetical protein
METTVRRAILSLALEKYAPSGHMPAMTSHELLDVLLSTLVRSHGGDRRRWRLVLGRIRVHSLETHPHCNWSVAPAGSARENALIERMLDELRAVHPVIAR